MNPCLLRRSLEDLAFSLPLGPLIADWRAATPKFIGGLTERMAGYLELRSPDWSVTDSGVLGDRSCQGRLFNGAASITLTPDELKLNFSNVARQAYDVVFETLRRTLHLMDAEFGDHPYDSCNLICVQHADLLDSDSADAYLAQFSYTSTLLVIDKIPQLHYEPSIRVVLPGADGSFRMQRTVEKSAARSGALFVSTGILFSKDMIASGSASEMVQCFEEACHFADRAIGLEWETIA